MPLAERLARWQTRRAWLFIVGGLLLAAASLPLVRQLGLDSAFTALLPADKPSVRDLTRIGNRVGGLTTLTVVIQSEDTEPLLRFAGDLVPELRHLGDSKVRSVDWNVAAYEEFVERHRHLYAGVEDLTEIRDALQARIDWERARANPFYVDLEDPPEDPVAVAERIRDRVRESAGGGTKNRERGRGFYLHPEGNLVAIFLRTDIPGGDAAAANALIARIDQAVAELGPSRYARDLKVEYTGDLMTTREEHDAIARELVIATVIASVLTLAVILFLFWRPRSLLLLGFSILVPVLVTFGIAELTVDSLNTSTAFLISIMVGNGVNPGIVWLARYFEERRKGADVEPAIALTHRGAWAGTLAAALGAALSYGSLMVADFKGFKDFGIISSVGMVVCWVLIFLLLPAITAASERILPMKLVASKDRGTLYGRSIMAVVRRAPGTILIVLGLVVAVSIFFVARAVAADPLEYNFRNLRSVREGSTRASHLTGRVSDIVGGAASGNAIAMLLPSREEVPGVVAQLQRMEQRGLMGVVRRIEDLLPKDQDAKVPLAREIRELMLEARERADPAQVARIDEYLPPEEIRALEPEDLPEEVARLYQERDGTRGRLLFISQPPNFSIWNGRDLVTWANRLRSVRLSDGTSPPLAGRPPVFADMIDVVVEDGPKAVAASFAATLLIVLFSFRRWIPRLLTIGSLLVGVTWMSGVMALLGMKLNFLNFVAFPITFGNGVDYAVNVMRRYVQERAETGATPEAAVSASVMETGGAVIACSLTTVFGYLSILTSANLALESFGMAMSISELTCLTAAVTGIPSLLLWWSRRTRASAK